MQKLFSKPVMRDLLVIVLATLIISLLMWLPYLLKLPNFFSYDFSMGMQTIYKNYDGLEYVVIAKSWYIPQIIEQITPDLPPSYFPAHFPGYSFFIFLFSPLFGYVKSMIFVSVLFTILSTLMFYVLLRDLKLTSSPLLLALISLILPARWLIIHSVGSSEPVFSFFVIAALYFFMKFEEVHKIKFLWLAGLSGMIAQISRPPAVLLFGALGLYLLWKIFIQTKEKTIITRFKELFSYYPLGLFPLGLIIVFTFYAFTTGNFFAYFHTGDNIHLSLPPYHVFNKEEYWVGDIWLEDIIYIFILGFSAGVLLFKRKLYPLAFFIFTFLAATTLVGHRDISRYSIVLAPFVLVAFDKFLTSKEFRIVLIIVALGVYFYAQNFILYNVAPIPNIGVYH